MPILSKKTAGVTPQIRDAVVAKGLSNTKCRALQVVAYGTPAAQGSKKHVGNGKLIEMSKRVAPWRETVKWAAIEAMSRSGCGMILGPVSAEIAFTIPKPKSAPKSRQTYPDRKPDGDKLLRAVFDSLSDAGAWEDDARVIDCRFIKVYPGEHADALNVPGVLIRLKGTAA